MRMLCVSGVSLVLVLALAVPAGARGPDGAWWLGACTEQLLDGPCEVKLEAKRGLYKREIKCQDGRGAHWEPGEWKEEYRDGGCLVKVEAKRDEFKEEIQCD
jgi:hypothetical protein